MIDEYDTYTTPELKGYAHPTSSQDKPDLKAGCFLVVADLYAGSYGARPHLLYVATSQAEADDFVKTLRTANPAIDPEVMQANFHEFFDADKYLGGYCE